MNEKILRELREIECQLSPENLSCDGEADPRWVRRQYRKLTARKTVLEKQLGYSPSFYELYPDLKP